MHGEVGMLFTFDQLGQYGFWMKDMRMDLDFVWLREGEIVDLTENVPAPKETFEELTVYQATVPIDSVLEFRAGWVERSVTLKRQPNPALPSLRYPQMVSTPSGNHLSRLFPTQISRYPLDPRLSPLSQPPFLPLHPNRNLALNPHHGPNGPPHPPCCHRTRPVN